MIIVTNYSLEYRRDSDLFYLRSREEGRCPFCQSALKPIGSRRRVLFRRDGSVMRLVVRRLRCCGCGRIHHELPDIVIPYKRYEAEAVESALFFDASKVRDYPCEQSTILRQRLWFLILCSYLEHIAGARTVRVADKCCLFNKTAAEPPKGWLSGLIQWALNSLSA